MIYFDVDSINHVVSILSNAAFSLLVIYFISDFDASIEIKLMEMHSN